MVYIILYVQQSKVLLINADALGTETLKNLVLPGVGEFFILDKHVISEVDISNNFFVSSTSLNQSRAECTKELLMEMNSDVKGSHRADDINILIHTGTVYI